MGCVDQCEAPGFALQVLKNHYNDLGLMKMVQESLDFLSTSPVGKDGFPVQYDMKTKTWSSPVNVSKGQAMYNIGKVIATGRKNKAVNTSKWEAFMREPI